MTKVISSLDKHEEHFWRKAVDIPQTVYALLYVYFLKALMKLPVESIFHHVSSSLQ